MLDRPLTHSVEISLLLLAKLRGEGVPLALLRRGRLGGLQRGLALRASDVLGAIGLPAAAAVEHP